MKILVVEDEKDLNKIITKYLKKSNYSVDSVYDGEEALDYINVGEYDVIILDKAGVMPQETGMLLEAIRSACPHLHCLGLMALPPIEDRKSVV